MIEAIFIPTQANLERNRRKAEVAYDYSTSNGNIPVIVSGGVGSLLNPGYSCEAEIIQERLLQLGMPDSMISLERKSTNNVENILFGLEMFHGSHLAICSYPSHIRRFIKIIEIGKRFGEIGDNLRVDPLETDEKFSERLYEIFAEKVTNRAIRNGLRNARVPGGFMKYAANYFMQICPF